MWAGKSSSYDTSPLLASISKGPQNLGANLPYLPKLKDSFFFYFQVNMVTYLIIFIYSFLIRVTFLEVLHFFKIQLDLGNQLFQVL